MGRRKKSPLGGYSSSSGLKMVQLRKSRMMQAMVGSICMGASWADCLGLAFPTSVGLFLFPVCVTD